MRPISRRAVLSATAVSLLSILTPAPRAIAARTGLQSYLRTNWSRDPFSFGSYSYLPTGIQQHVRNALEMPVGKRLFFAGEATHPSRNSTVHAAYESGIRAASAVTDTGAKRIAIVGAGVSGLAAAHHLSGHGHDVIVFEARDRIGGRLWTDRSTGIPLDLGASWIHGTRNNPLTRIASELDAERVETDFDYILRGNDGRRISNRSFPDWLVEIAEIQQNAGADANQLNLEDYESREDYDGPDVIFPGGYDQILEALAGQYDVHLGTPVRAVRHGTQGITIVTETNSQSFDAALITLPLGVLKAGSVEFAPTLPTAKLNAIARLGMGLLDKLYLHFDTPFWGEDSTWILTPETGLPRGQFNQWLNLYPILKTPILVGFNGGTAAHQLSEVSDVELVSLAEGVLRGAYPP